MENEVKKPKWELSSALKRLLKVLNFTVIAVEDNSTPNATVYKVLVENPITGTGSNILPDGSPMQHTSDEIYVAEEDIEKFNEGCVEDGDKIVYKGSLKLDVSRPKFRSVNGKMEAIAPPRLWLVTVPFRLRGNEFRTNTREMSREAIISLFKGGSKSVAGTEGVATAGKAVEPVDTGKKPETAKK